MRTLPLPPGKNPLGKLMLISLPLLLFFGIAIVTGYEIYEAFSEEESEAALFRQEISFYYFVGKKVSVDSAKISDTIRTGLMIKRPLAFSNGDITFQVIDLSRPENEHFITEFKAVPGELIVRRGKNFEKCNRLTELLENREAVFDYIQDCIERIQDISPEEEDQ